MKRPASKSSSSKPAKKAKPAKTEAETKKRRVSNAQWHKSAHKWGIKEGQKLLISVSWSDHVCSMPFFLQFLGVTVLNVIGTI